MEKIKPNISKDEVLYFIDIEYPAEITMDYDIYLIDFGKRYFNKDNILLLNSLFIKTSKI
jgi:hypothetical protein